MKQKLIKGLSCFLLLSVLTVGCSPAERPVPENQTTPEVQPGRYERVQEPNTPMEPQEGQDLSIRAEQIVNEVVRLNEVQSATVVISDETALVGVNLASGVDGEMTTEVKNKIEDVVKQADRSITRVAVSADPDIFSKIENIARETGRGRPISGFADEIEDLFRRILPNA
ncbi:YhcN/YlaJ family sporulation lipoprotein [Alkaliphilus crotonatoxidans]